MQPTPPLNSGTIASLNEEGGVIHASGRWDVHHIDRLEKKLAAGWQPDRRSTTLNASAIERLDTAGAWLLKRTLMQFEKSGYRIELQGMQQAHTTLIELISSESVEPPHPVEIGLLER
ncbi:STAS domain-containing protein [Candidatus Reidiella endopervernicosa]|nr:STAS domain-containing protein [Candidatus Reidiella endopervernicosa]QKQ26017.1 STAS domain-containing protein [Candidatus Reidiella endopervernicosa]